MIDSFGSEPSAERLDPEDHQGPLSHEDLVGTISGYRALDERASGKYASFLRQGAGCPKCAEDSLVPGPQQPVPVLCGTVPFEPGDASGAITRAAEALNPFRREDKSIRFNPDDPAAAARLKQFLDAAGLRGLSIGQCGWSDMTMRLRGTGMARGTRVMTLGNDWYPLTQCSRFLTDAYKPDPTLLKFLGLLRGHGPAPSVPEFEAFVRDERVYLGNALLCYRTGWARTGDENLSWRSFRHCQEHLVRHIDAVAPEILVTFGKSSCASVARIGTALEPQDANTVAVLGDIDRQGSLKAVMTRHHLSRGLKGLRVSVAGHEVSFHPLCHPSMPNRYPDDYDSLRVALGWPRAKS